MFDLPAVSRYHFGMLIEAFNLDREKQIVAFVGGGGKTSLMFALATALGAGVVTTTTTRIFTAQMKLAPAVCLLDERDEVYFGERLLGPVVGGMSRLEAFLAQFGTCLVVGKVVGEKALGVPPHLPGELLARAGVRHVLVEADGSRMRPVKAPAAHEPVIPPQATRVVPVVGMDALERPLADVAHRPERVRSVLGDTAALDDRRRLTPGMVARLLIHKEGGLKGVPPAAAVIPALNKVESEHRLAAARRIARRILDNPATLAQIPQVVLSAAQTDRPVREIQGRVAAVVLAAGRSRRMGKANKLLLPWRVDTVLGQTLANVAETAVHQTVVVTGHDADRVGRIAADRGVETLFNDQVAQGGEMITSLQVALHRLPAHIGAVLVVLGDQPQVPPAVIEAILRAFWQGKGKIVVPSYQGRRGNPVLIDRRFFAQLQALPPQSAPRHLLRRHPETVYELPVDSPAVLQDLDRPEDYERLRP